MIRKVIQQTKGRKAIDGAGVHLVRVLGDSTAHRYDPFLMLDAFDSFNKADFEAGFPMHPHRGIETISFISKGSMTHRDHLGTEAVVQDGEAQWLTAGNGAEHEEMPGGNRLLGTQLWLNIPGKYKRKAAPAYRGIRKDEIKEFPFEGGTLRLATGEYKGEQGYQGKYVPVDFYDIHLDPGAKVKIPVKDHNCVFLFTLIGDVKIAGDIVYEKTGAHTSNGDLVKIEALDKPVEVLLYSAPRLNEEIAWYGPIVMNTREELIQAFGDYQNGTFIQRSPDYSDR